MLWLVVDVLRASFHDDSCERAISSPIPSAVPRSDHQVPRCGKYGSRRSVSSPKRSINRWCRKKVKVLSRVTPKQTTRKAVGRRFSSARQTGRTRPLAGRDRFTFGGRIRQKQLEVLDEFVVGHFSTFFDDEMSDSVQGEFLGRRHLSHPNNAALPDHLKKTPVAPTNETNENKKNKTNKLTNPQEPNKTLYFPPSEI